MNRRILFLLNPLAGTGNKPALRNLIIDHMRQANIPYEMLSTNAKGDYRFLEDKLTREQVTDIVIVGGDGSISAVAGSLRHTGVQFGVIPCGSGNGLALTAGISKDPGKALETIVAGQSSYIDSLLINERFSCMLSGIGFDARVAHEFAHSKRRGLFTYMKLTTREFFRAYPYPFGIKVNNKEISTKAFFISIANSNQFGNQFTIAPRASLNDGMLDIVVVQKMSKLQTLWSIWHQIRSGEIRQDFYPRTGILYFQAERLEILNPRLAPLHIDGDPAETSDRFIIEVVPTAFRLIQPSTSLT